MFEIFVVCITVIDLADFFYTTCFLTNRKVLGNWLLSRSVLQGKSVISV